MIHSMSGGILNDAGSYTFVKVKFDGSDASYWYISDMPVEEGDTVKAPRGAGGAIALGKVVRVENAVSGQVTPVPLRSAKRIVCVINENDTP